MKYNTDWQVPLHTLYAHYKRAHEMSPTALVTLVFSLHFNIYPTVYRIVSRVSQNDNNKTESIYFGILEETMFSLAFKMDGSQV